MMVPQILSTIQVMFTTTAERQGVSAFYGALAGVATVGGPILGALLITGNAGGYGWRTIFLVNLPVGIVAIVLAMIYMPKARSPHPLHLDFVGVGLILLAMLMLMYPLIEGRELDWPWWTFASMAGSLVVFVLFAFSQVRKERKDGSPLVVPHLFRQRSFVAGIILSGSFYAIISGFFLILTLFLQVGLGYSILKAGPPPGFPSPSASASRPACRDRCWFPASAATSSAPVRSRWASGWRSSSGRYAFRRRRDAVRAHSGAGHRRRWHGLRGGVRLPVHLAEVPLKDAGSASGVTNAVGQIGGAIGGRRHRRIFFGLIGSQATVSVDSIRGELTASPRRRGSSAFVQPDVIASFETCFHDRANAKGLLGRARKLSAGRIGPGGPGRDAAGSRHGNRRRRRQGSARRQRAQPSSPPSNGPSSGRSAPWSPSSS